MKNGEKKMWDIQKSASTHLSHRGARASDSVPRSREGLKHYSVKESVLEELLTEKFPELRRGTI